MINEKRVENILDVRLKGAKSVAEIYTIVKDVVRQSLDMEQAGVLIGMSDLGIHPRGFIGAFYSPQANTIVINKNPLGRLTAKSFYNHYLFHVLLHEYVHSLGFLDEASTRQLVYEISKANFGDTHVLTRLAENLEQFLPAFTYPSSGFEMPKGMDLEYIHGIDVKESAYIG